MYQFIFTNDNNISNNEIKKDISTIIYKELEKGNLNKLIFYIIEKEQTDIVIRYNNTSVQIKSTKNQKKKENIDISSINLGECETELKSYYNISNIDPLLIILYLKQKNNVSIIYFFS